jgi:Xaa-Pro dipeptidase
METRTVAEQLAEAQARAASLFRAIEAEQLVRAGQSEDQIDQAIFALAQEKFGVEKHWHRRVVRSGPHTRMLFKELPPDRVVEEDDLVSIDLGPVFDSMEADFGRSYVIGNNAAKIHLQGDLEYLFHSCRDFYFQHPELTGAQFYQHVCDASKERGWTFGGVHAAPGGRVSVRARGAGFAAKPDPSRQPLANELA